MRSSVFKIKSDYHITKFLKKIGEWTIHTQIDKEQPIIRIIAGIYDEQGISEVQYKIAWITNPWERFVNYTNGKYDEDKTDICHTIKTALEIIKSDLPEEIYAEFEAQTMMATIEHFGAKR